MKVVLVDDEQLALDFLEFQLNKVMEPDSIHTFTYLSVEEQRSMILETDVVFLDVEMPGKNGLELAEQILELNPDLEIIFVTGFNEYAVEAFELNALDYIVKPVQEERLKKAIARLKKEESTTIDRQQHLHIQLFGELTFIVGDEKVESLKWRTIKSQEIFLYLLHFREKIIRKSELVEKFWAELPLDKSYAQLYTAIYHIRNVLKDYRHHLTIKNVTDGYKLMVKDVSLDVVEWENGIKQAPPIHIETLETYETIMKIYTEPYLKYYDFTWAEAEQFRLEQMWTDIAMRMAKCYEENHFYEDAVKWYDKVFSMNPYDEDAAFALMKLYAALDYGLLVNHHYTQLERALKDIDVKMSASIRKWYQQWKTR